MSGFIVITALLVIVAIGIGFYPLFNSEGGTKRIVTNVVVICVGVIIPFIALYIYFGAPIIITLMQQH